MFTLVQLAISFMVTEFETTVTLKRIGYIDVYHFQVSYFQIFRQDSRVKGQNNYVCGLLTPYLKKVIRLAAVTFWRASSIVISSLEIPDRSGQRSTCIPFDVFKLECGTHLAGVLKICLIFMRVLA